MSAVTDSSTDASTIRPPTLAPPLLVNVKQACQMLGLGRTTLYHLVQRGIVKSVRIGGALRFRFRDLCEFVDALAADDELAQSLAAPTAGGARQPPRPSGPSSKRRADV